MAYDPLSNTLLIACKGSPSIEKENLYTGYKAVYTFNLEKEELIEEIVLQPGSKEGFKESVLEVIDRFWHSNNKLRNRVCKSLIV